MMWCRPQIVILCQAKVQEEVDSVVHTDRPTVGLEDRARMPYTDAALHEVAKRRNE